MSSISLIKAITNVVAVDGDWTLTLSDVDGITAGMRIDIGACPIAGVNLTNMSVIAVDTTNLTVSYTHDGDNQASTATTGQVHLHVQWIDTDFVEVLLGYTPAGDDATYLQTVTDAANDWAFTRRQEAGYTSDWASTAPGHNAQLGTGLYALALYRERGSVDSFASFQDAPTPGTFGTMGQINKLLGIPRAAFG